MPGLCYVIPREIFCRECGFKSMTTSPDDSDLCAVCLERACSVAAEGLVSLPLVSNNYSMSVFFFSYVLCEEMGRRFSISSVQPLTFHHQLQDSNMI